MEKQTALTLLFLTTLLTAGESSLNFVGVNYGTQGNNLPPPKDVIELLKRNNVGKIRLFEPLPEVLEALRGSEIEVSLGIRNEDLQLMSVDQTAVAAWIAAHMEPYIDDVAFSYVTVGNEVIPGTLGKFVVPVLHSVQYVLDTKLWTGIKATTVIPGTALSSSYPPSAAQFSAEAAEEMTGVLSFLSSAGSPLMINVYPYFAYASDPVSVRLDYAQFTATEMVVQDGPLSYSNLFDAMVDSFVWAMESAGVSDVDLVVSETGWPSSGNGEHTTPALAATYNKNFLSHMESSVGTPKRPGIYIEGYLFAVFNENLKPAGVEQNFGLFYPDMTPVYPVFS